MQYVILKTLEMITNTSRTPIENVWSENFNCDDTGCIILEGKIFKITIDNDD